MQRPRNLTVGHISDQLSKVLALVDACENNVTDGEYKLDRKYKAARAALELSLSGTLSDLAAAQAFAKWCVSDKYDSRETSTRAHVIIDRIQP